MTNHVTSVHEAQSQNAIALIFSWFFTGGHSLFFSALAVLVPEPEPLLSLLIKHSGLCWIVAGHSIPVISGYFKTPCSLLPFALPQSFPSGRHSGTSQKWTCFMDECGRPVMRNLPETPCTIIVSSIGRKKYVLNLNKLFYIEPQSKSLDWFVCKCTVGINVQALSFASRLKSQRWV